LLHTLIRTTKSWAIFEFDNSSPNRHGAQQSVSDTIVPPGVYILLRQDGNPLEVLLIDASARSRQPTLCNTPARLMHYRQRTRERDGSLRLLTATWSRLKAAHIFPRVHDIEVNLLK